MGSAFLPSQSVCLSPAPRVKRPRLEAVKRLNFGFDEMEEPPLPDFSPQDITPPPSPEVPADLWGEGCVSWGTGVLRELGRVSILGHGLGLGACRRVWSLRMDPGLSLEGNRRQESQDSPGPFLGPWMLVLT